MKPVQPPTQRPPTGDAATGTRPSTRGAPALESTATAGDTLEMSSLLLELVHAAYATRAADGAAGGSGHGASSPAGSAAGGAGISPHAIRAAIHIHQHRERTIGELAHGLGISMGWASRVAGELEGAGMITRSTDPSDRRVVRIVLTDEATALVEGVYRWRGDAVARALDGIDGPGRAAVRRFLRSVVDELSATPERRPATERQPAAAREERDRGETPDTGA